MTTYSVFIYFNNTPLSGSKATCPYKSLVFRELKSVILSLKTKSAGYFVIR
ncbi:hypothetical protein GXM_06300 [Nostoc sphaeroides CCNUC1]|uniref:Uncharacterized protein n=1 Tax=Nostoc sphaeroides CCNUC1 TaxID=2653204 RepID=A0A5P8W9D8_9NOSO|nr:hypothetical protein GXM_06300 [Nostoc sphaeroides CCNUC1]